MVARLEKLRRRAGVVADDDPLTATADEPDPDQLAGSAG
jgi:hypothetical protein